MTLVLSHVDYLSVGVTSRGTTQILPQLDPQQTQKFVVGDHDGIIHIYGVKKGELQLIFKSLPGEIIKKVVLGGTIGTPKDKIFFAYGNSVKGYTKKGKMFLEFDTSLIDPISAMFVLGPDLAVCARDLYHRYQNCKDADSYLAGEILHDIILINNDGNSIIAVIACGDSAIRVLTGTSKPIILRLASVPTILKLYREGENESRDRILVGTQDGKIGLLILQGNKTIRIIWLLNNVGSEITSLDTYELDDGIDILVGRQDGTIEVFRFPIDDEEIVPTLRYRYNAGESISSAIGGIIGSIGSPEILVTTYSGRIFGLTTKSPGSLEAGADDLAINRLKMDIRELETKLNEANDTGSQHNDAFTPLTLSVNYRMHLDKDSASYLLSIELDTPIDNVLIQCDAPIELLQESNNAVLSLSTCDPHENNFILATYRCQMNTNRLETRIRTIEGQSGTLQIYVTTQIQPKCCRKIKIPIYALSMHVRLHDADNIDNNEVLFNGPYNELRLSGGFTVAEMHAWLSLALADIPERPYLQDNEVTLNYVSTIAGTILKCKYKKGSAVFMGENISTIIILRDLLTKEATKRKIKLDVYCNVEDETVRRILELIHPRLESIHELKEKLKILDTLQELEMMNDTSGNLCTIYQKLLNEEDNLRMQIAKDPDNLQRLYGVVIDLYVDWQRAKGALRMTSLVAAEKLNPALESRSLSSIFQVFFGLQKNNE
ncbi:hypothetical protein PV328_007422 [Microctonus aethiopoides]|uniref:Bardet-Biedl syndrome 7 n=1 Tax=Microctonus aethiopoides TaxID=144406 RepID=A0AA39C8U0_9HYME|nr:hypothetical protein PV328_007422 [Microctonus aethiopoides]